MWELCFSDIPFGVKNSGCGDPALQLDCDYQAQMPLITIGGHPYYVQDPHKYSMPSNKLEKNSSHNMTLIDTCLQGDKCNPTCMSHYTAAQFWSNPQFHIRSEYRNLTLLKQCAPDIIRDLTPLPCNSSWYYKSSKFESGVDGNCDTRVVIPIQKSEKRPTGNFFRPEFDLNISWNVSENCTKCDSNGGRCAYHNRSIQFCCDCSGKLCANKCPGRGVAIGTGALLFIAVLLAVYRKRRVSSFLQKPHFSNVEKFLQDYVHEMPTRYSYSQLKKITNNFADRLGEGGFGVVYKGKLHS
ncbi:hypothetical protein KI387_010775, partial [Taxus chinensis]